MNSSRTRVRRRFVVEALEGRVALSHMGAVVEDGPHHNRGGQPAEVHALRHGADDPAGHDANDDRGDAAASRRNGGADDPAGHDANDDKGGHRAMALKQGAAHAAGTAAKAGKIAASVGKHRHGADDPAGHR